MKNVQISIFRNIHYDHILLFLLKIVDDAIENEKPILTICLVKILLATNYYSRPFNCKEIQNEEEA